MCPMGHKIRNERAAGELGKVIPDQYAEVVQAIDDAGDAAVCLRCLVTTKIRTVSVRKLRGF